MSFRMLPRMSGSVSSSARRRAGALFRKGLHERKEKQQFLQRFAVELRSGRSNRYDATLEKPQSRVNVQSGRVRNSITMWKEARKIAASRVNIPTLPPSS